MVSSPDWEFFFSFCASGSTPICGIFAPHACDSIQCLLFVFSYSIPGNLCYDLSKSFTLMTMPTTGECGPRGGLGDFEYHSKVATRFGVSYTHNKEDRYTDSATNGPDETQVKNTDGFLFFQTGSLAPGVTVIQANFDMGSVDLGVKYKGWNIDLEFFGRKLSNFDATGPLPLSVINDYGYALQVSKMVIPQTLMLYGINSYFWDQWGRRPWEAGGGINVFR